MVYNKTEVNLNKSIFNQKVFRKDKKCQAVRLGFGRPRGYRIGLV